MTDLIIMVLVYTASYLLVKGILKFTNIKTYLKNRNIKIFDRKFTFMRIIIVSILFVILSSAFTESKYSHIITVGIASALIAIHDYIER